MRCRDDVRDLRRACFSARLRTFRCSANLGGLLPTRPQSAGGDCKQRRAAARCKFRFLRERLAKGGREMLHHCRIRRDDATRDPPSRWPGSTEFKTSLESLVLCDAGAFVVWVRIAPENQQWAIGVVEHALANRVRLAETVCADHKELY